MSATPVLKFHSAQEAAYLNTVPLYPFLLPQNRSSLIKMNQLQSTSAATLPPRALRRCRRAVSCRRPRRQLWRSTVEVQGGGRRSAPPLPFPLPTSERSMTRPNAVRSPPPLSRGTRTVTGRGRSTVETPDAVRPSSLTHSRSLGLVSNMMDSYRNELARRRGYDVLGGVYFWGKN